MEKIFVATDGSEGGMRAVDFAARLATGLKSQLSILTVTSSVPSGEWSEFARMEHMTRGDLIDVEGQTVLRNARARATAHGAMIEQCHALVGDAAEQIVDIIAEKKPDVVVVGRRGRGRLEGLLLGSVSQKLASLSSVPVIVVP